MEINRDQYKLVNEYCSKAVKQFYDVELELTDHMVNYIEDRIKDPNQFTELFNEIKKEFNPTVIQKIIKEKTISIEANIKNQLKTALVEFISLPKIALTFLLVAVVIWLDQNHSIEKIAGSFIHLINLLNITYSFGKGKLATDNIRDKRKKLLSMHIVRTYHVLMIIPTVFYLLISLGVIFEITTNYYTIIYKIALYMLPFVILLNLAWQQVYIQTQFKIRQSYPNAFAS